MFLNIFLEVRDMYIAWRGFCHVKLYVLGLDTLLITFLAVAEPIKYETPQILFCHPFSVQSKLHTWLKSKFMAKPVQGIAKPKSTLHYLHTASAFSLFCADL
jgi:hypothetical protein